MEAASCCACVAEKQQCFPRPVASAHSRSFLPQDSVGLMTHLRLISALWAAPPGAGLGLRSASCSWAPLPGQQFEASSVSVSASWQGGGWVSAHSSFLPGHPALLPRHPRGRDLREGPEMGEGCLSPEIRPGPAPQLCLRQHCPEQLGHGVLQAHMWVTCVRGTWRGDRKGHGPSPQPRLRPPPHVLGVSVCGCVAACVCGSPAALQCVCECECVSMSVCACVCERV